MLPFLMETWRAEPTEEIKEIMLGRLDQLKSLNIGTNLPNEIKASLVEFLVKNLDVFAWDPTDL